MLDHQQQEQLKKALESAYPKLYDLEMMVHYSLQENLDAITSPGNLNRVLFELIRWAITQGRIKELVENAYERNSGNYELSKFYHNVWKPLINKEMEALPTPATNDPPMAISTNANNNTGGTMAPPSSENKTTHSEPSIDYSPATGQTVALYFSYANEDVELLMQLQKQLVMLKRSGLITLWSRKEIRPGEIEEAEKAKHLHNAQIIILIVSPHFLASDRAYNEAVYAMQLHESMGVAVLPILARLTAGWQYAAFGRLQVLPKTEVAISQYSGAQREKLLQEIELEIREIVESLRLRPSE